MSEAEAYAAPTPKVFYIHDDLSDFVQRLHGGESEACGLTRELFDLVCRETHVRVLTVAEQIEQLIAQGGHTPFDATIGIGRAGERVARQLHDRTGWFPHISRVDVTREEDGQGGYNVVSTTPVSLREQLPDMDTYVSIAVVDDTVFSGLTMCTVIEALPTRARARTQAFCLRGVGVSRQRVAALCPLTMGFAAPGSLLDEVSFINASGMVMRVGIRHPDRPPQAFFERPMWMQAWFPHVTDEVMTLCTRLNALLEPDGKPAQF